MPAPIRCSLVALLLLSPALVSARGGGHEDEPVDPRYWSAGALDPVYSIDCTEHKNTGYKDGAPYEITVVTIDGQMVEIESANARAPVWPRAAQGLPHDEVLRRVRKSSSSTRAHHPARHRPGTRTADDDDDNDAPVPSPTPSHIGWAKLLARVFALDVTIGRKCGGRMPVLEVVDDPDHIARLLHGARARA